MTRWVLLSIALAASCAPARRVIEADPRSQLSPSQMQADFDVMRSSLEEAHTGLYRYTPKPEMDRVFTSQRARLDRPMTKLEFLAVLKQTTAAIRCGHTGVQPDSETDAALAAAPLFPLQVLIENGKLFAVANGRSEDSTIRPGMEIVRINGRTSREILDRMLPSFSVDGDVETGKWRRIEGGFARNYWMLIEQAKEFTIEGTTTTAKLAGVTTADRAAYRNPVHDWTQGNLSLRFLKDPEIAQIHIRGFGGSDYPQWIENTFRTLQEKETKTLIIDLRGNGGGEDLYGALLVSYLTDKPFRYFDHIRIKTISPVFDAETDWNASEEPRLRAGTTVDPDGGFLITPRLHPGVAEQPPGKYPFLGRTIVLINGRTFSTAADFCAVVHHLKRATFIGEETGGGYYGNNSGLETVVTLPHSKARVIVPMYEYWNAVPGYEGKRRGTLPDVAVETTAANLLRGVDEQLDAALKLAR